MWRRGSDAGRSLSTAVREGDVRAVRKMLEQGADPNVRDPDDDVVPIHYAINQGPEMVQLLIDHGADVNIPGRGAMALANADARGHHDVAAVLRKAGAQLRIPGDEFEMDPRARMQIEKQIRHLRLQVEMQFHDRPAETIAAELEKLLKIEFPADTPPAQQAKLRQEVHTLVLRACGLDGPTTSK